MPCLRRRVQALLLVVTIMILSGLLTACSLPSQQIEQILNQAVTEQTTTQEADESLAGGKQPSGNENEAEATSGNKTNTQGEALTGPIALTLVNNSGEDVCYVYISLTTDSSWGTDWLGPDIIGSGESYDFHLDAGTWDFRADNCNGDTLDTRFGVTINNNQTWTIGGAPSSQGGGSSGGGPASLTLYNNSNSTVCYVYISPSTSSSWGSDWLGTDVVPAGSSYTFYVTPGTYDYKATDCSGNTLASEFGVYLSGSHTWTITGGGSSGGGTATIYAYNNSSSTVCYVYISPSTSSSWGSDWLGSDVMPAGSSYTFYVTPGTYDLKATDCSGGVIDTEYGVYISGSYNWYIP